MTTATPTPGHALPGQHAAAKPDRWVFSGRALPPQRPDLDAIVDSPEFVRLRRFVFPMSAVFLAWFITYVPLSSYTHTPVSQSVFGLVDIGLLLGLTRFVSTAPITVACHRSARRRLEPHVALIRAHSGAEPR